MKKFRFLFLVLALILVVGMTTGVIVRKQTGSQTVLQHSGGGSAATTTPATSSEEDPPAGGTKIAVVGYTNSLVSSPIKVNGESPAVIQDPDGVVIFIEPGDILSADSKHYWSGYDENGTEIDDTSSSSTPQYIPSEGVVVVFVTVP